MLSFAVKRELVAFDARIRGLEEQQKRENARRNVRGIGSPLKEAHVERLSPEVVVELEAKAVAGSPSANGVRAEGYIRHAKLFDDNAAVGLA